MSSWEDRRALFQRGKEVHVPTVTPAPRRPSATLEKITSNESTGSNNSASSTPTAANRRRSSAAAQAGTFGSLMGLKRGSEDYTNRRTSLADQQAKSGMFGGWYNSTFRGAGSPTSPTGGGGGSAGGAADTTQQGK